MVLAAMRRVQASMAAMKSPSGFCGMAGTASSVVFAQLCYAVQKRVSGPSDRSVHFLLQADIHYLAALLDQKVHDALASHLADQVKRASQIIRIYFVSSPDVFSTAQPVQISKVERMHLLKEQLATHTVLSRSFQGKIGNCGDGGPCAVGPARNCERLARPRLG